MSKSLNKPNTLPPVWIEGLNALERTLVMGGAALLITAVQRQAMRLALERDPRLPRRM